MKRKKFTWLGYCLPLIMTIGFIFASCRGDEPKETPVDWNYPGLITLGEIDGKTGADEITITGPAPLTEDGAYTDNTGKVHQLLTGERRGKAGTEVTLSITYNGTDNPGIGQRLRLGSLRFNYTPLRSTVVSSTPINTDPNKLREATYTFKMPPADVTITARFEEIKVIVDPYIALRKELEDIIAGMNMEEKIGQMTQAELNHITPADVSRYFLGSVLSGGGQGPRGETTSVTDWRAWTNSLLAESKKTKVNYVYGIDAVHGHTNAINNSTVFPHNIGLGAIYAGDRDEGLDAAEREGIITRNEMLACGIRWNFAPLLGVAENPRWGRTYESYSENYEVVTEMGVAYITGLQTDKEVGACMKHFVLEGQVLSPRPNKGNVLTDFSLNFTRFQEILAPYQAGVNANALSAMGSFSSVHGVDCHINTELLTGVLKGDLGFQGFIVSDWGAIKSASPPPYKNQIERSMNAGIDMIMAVASRSDWVDFITQMRALINENRITEARINDAVMRILLFKKYFGILDNPEIPAKYLVEVGTDANRAAAREIAEKTLVLLKNKDKVIEKMPAYNNILIAGEGSANLGRQCGGWTIKWQGVNGNPGLGASINIEQAIKEKLQGVSGKYVTRRANGSGGMEASDGGAAGRSPDVIIAVFSERPYAETQGDDLNQLALEGPDRAMLNNIKTAYPGKPIVAVILSGRPMAITQGQINDMDAIIAAWLPGSEGGPAIANMLFDPALQFVGKTAYTWRDSYVSSTTYPPTYTSNVTFPYGTGLRKEP